MDEQSRASHAFITYLYHLWAILSISFSFCPLANQIFVLSKFDRVFIAKSVFFKQFRAQQINNPILINNLVFFFLAGSFPIRLKTWIQIKIRFSSHFRLILLNFFSSKRLNCFGPFETGSMSWLLVDKRSLLFFYGDFSCFSIPFCFVRNGVMQHYGATLLCTLRGDTVCNTPACWVHYS